MTCRCGYSGSYWKMAFDVDNAYNWLKEHGQVYTIRPNFGKVIHYGKAHIHRNSKWTGEIISKHAVIDGEGEESLRSNAEFYLKNSGFNSLDDWIGKLIEMHGTKVTTFKWIIYDVKMIARDDI